MPLAFEPKGWKDEEGPDGLVDAAAMTDLEERVTASEVKFVDAKADLTLARPAAALVIWRISLAHYEAEEEPVHAEAFDLVVA